MSNIDRLVNAFLWGFALFFAWSFAAVLAVGGVREGGASVAPSLAGAAIVAAAAPAVLLVAGALHRRGWRKHPAIGLLEELRPILGGQLVLPSILLPITQPRLVTQVEGTPAEIRLVRIKSAGGRLLVEAGRADEEGARERIRNAWLVVMVAAPGAQALDAWTRSGILAWRSHALRKDVRKSGDEGLDSRLAFAGAAPLVASAARPPLRGALLALLDANRPFASAVRVGPASRLDPGASYRTVLSDSLDAAAVAQLPARLLALSRMLGSTPPTGE